MHSRICIDSNWKESFWKLQNGSEHSLEEEIRTETTAALEVAKNTLGSILKPAKATTHGMWTGGGGEGGSGGGSEAMQEEIGAQDLPEEVATCHTVRPPHLHAWKNLLIDVTAPSLKWALFNSYHQKATMRIWDLSCPFLFLFSFSFIVSFLFSFSFLSCCSFSFSFLFCSCLFFSFRFFFSCPFLFFFLFSFFFFFCPFFFLYFLFFPFLFCPFLFVAILAQGSNHLPVGGAGSAKCLRVNSVGGVACCFDFRPWVVTISTSGTKWRSFRESLGQLLKRQLRTRHHPLRSTHSSWGILADCVERACWGLLGIRLRKGLNEQQTLNNLKARPDVENFLKLARDSSWEQLEDLPGLILQESRNWRMWPTSFEAWIPQWWIVDFVEIASFTMFDK